MINLIKHGYSLRNTMKIKDWVSNSFAIEYFLKKFHYFEYYSRNLSLEIVRIIFFNQLLYKYIVNIVYIFFLSKSSSFEF